MEFKKDSKIALIIGNGNSTKQLLDYGFHNIPDNVDTFATSGAYKYCKALNWWPTYYVLTDIKVLTHKVELFNSLLADPTIKTKNFFLTCIHKETELKFNDPFEKLVNHSHIESGISCFKIIETAEPKYDYVILIGIDNNYTWVTDKVKKYDDITNLAIVKERIKKHPSYFWEGYIEKGDILSWDWKAEINKPVFCNKKHGKFIDRVTALLNKDITVINLSLSSYPEKHIEKYKSKNIYVQTTGISKYLDLIKDIK